MQSHPLALSLSRARERFRSPRQEPLLPKRNHKVHATVIPPVHSLTITPLAHAPPSLGCLSKKVHLQWYLAHKRTPTPLGPASAVSYELGTPVNDSGTNLTRCHRSQPRPPPDIGGDRTPVAAMWSGVSTLSTYSYKGLVSSPPPLLLQRAHSQLRRPPHTGVPRS